MIPGGTDARIWGRVVFVPYYIEIGSRLFVIIIIDCESHEYKENIKEGEDIRGLEQNKVTQHL